MSEKLLSRKERREITGLSEATLWRLEKAGQFVQRLQLSPGRVGWPESRVMAWIESRQPVGNNLSAHKMA